MYVALCALSNLPLTFVSSTQVLRALVTHHTTAETPDVGPSILSAIAVHPRRTHRGRRKVHSPHADIRWLTLGQRKRLLRASRARCYPSCWLSSPRQIVIGQDKRRFERGNMRIRRRSSLLATRSAFWSNLSGSSQGSLHIYILGRKRRLPRRHAADWVIKPQTPRCQVPGARWRKGTTPCVL